MSEDEKLVANERAKLLASYVNNLAAGTFVAAFIVFPLSTGQASYAWAGLGIVMSVILHMMARNVLWSLKA
jgi:hypothetical protein